MSANFEDLMRRLRIGDEHAARELVSQYEPFIRRAMRWRISRLQLNAVADSADICQNVLKSFMLGLVAGDFDLRSSKDLEKLLLGIAKRKFAMFARGEFADRRDRTRTEALQPWHDRADSKAEDPQKTAQEYDFFATIKGRLMPDECELFEQRRLGRSWQDIAAELGLPQAALRKRLSRAMNRIATELGIEEDA